MDKIKLFSHVSPATPVPVAISPSGFRAFKSSYNDVHVGEIVKVVPNLDNAHGSRVPAHKSRATVKTTAIVNVPFNPNRWVYGVVVAVNAEHNWASIDVGSYTTAFDFAGITTTDCRTTDILAISRKAYSTMTKLEKEELETRVKDDDRLVDLLIFDTYGDLDAKIKQVQDNGWLYKLCVVDGTFNIKYSRYSLGTNTIASYGIDPDFVIRLLNAAKVYK
ncbi:MAG: hypothetical protein RSC43_00230 [Clostridia bacterium]